MHAEFWGRIAATPCAAALRVDELKKQELTVQLLHTALEHIFLSIPEMPNAQLSDHLEPFIDRPLLHKLLQEQGVVEEPEVIMSQAKLVSETILGTDYQGTKMIEHTVYESPRELIYGAFEQCFIDFTNHIERILITGFHQMGKRLNRYAVVSLLPHLTPHGRIVSLELSFGEDIRHIHYRESFPSGRYSPNVSHDDNLRDVQSLLADN
ncbi:hypothetical protein BIZ78_gp261 [Erwinia phage vB_EamM_Caitlin]|uniref:hypothetical protein n=1 Tax=Erwinia phage vB_EamM_Caitlin TaxID=1883379 RepID=UPI00081D1318|nr:hypothetical protein BIZ78_gp261 [Erwinia phage vB_EamM_Caitlin]ANZ48314.1 hypothetical protein CAITLIN_19 [Erwinia phage vB_EamM_Caitlin]